MSTVVTPPPLSPAAPPAAPVLAMVQAPPAYPRPLRWTADEFHRVEDSGIWENRRPMLIGGVVLEQGMANPRHASSVYKLVKAIEAVGPAGHHVRNQEALDLGQDVEPMPDVALVPGDNIDYEATHPTTAALVVEVSDTTLFFDQTTKAELYAAAGVPEYWVLDLAGRVLHVYRDPRPLSPGGTAYQSHTTHPAGESVSAPGGGAVAVDALLPPAE